MSTEARLGFATVRFEGPDDDFRGPSGAMVMYYELALMGVRNVMCEALTESQDKKDRAHIVALRNQQKVEKSFDIDHCRGGGDPLLWLPDIFLGVINLHHLGNSWFYDALSEFLILESKTAGSY